MPHGMASKGRRHQPAYMFAHSLVNKLSAIVGNCDLLYENTESGTEYARRLAVIRDLAESAVKEIMEHQRKAEAESRKAGYASFPMSSVVPSIGALRRALWALRRGKVPPSLSAPGILRCGWRS
jgi:hypothetical protein